MFLKKSYPTNQKYLTFNSLFERCISNILIFGFTIFPPFIQCVINKRFQIIRCKAL